MPSIIGVAQNLSISPTATQEINTTSVQYCMDIERILSNHWTDVSEILSVIRLGDLVYLGENLKSTVAYNRDREEDSSGPINFSSVRQVVTSEPYWDIFLFDMSASSWLKFDGVKKIWSRLNG